MLKSLLSAFNHTLKMLLQIYKEDMKQIFLREHFRLTIITIW